MLRNVEVLRNSPLMFKKEMFDIEDTKISCWYARFGQENIFECDMRLPVMKNSLSMQMHPDLKGKPLDFETPLQWLLKL